MKKILIISLALLLTGSTLWAQQKPDTVIVELGKSSRVIFTIKDRSDIRILRQYDYQALFTDILNRIDTTKIALPTQETDDKISLKPQEEVTWDDDDKYEWSGHWNKSQSRRVRHSFNLDLGMNNYLEEGKFPDETNELYTVRPWGSWYVGLNSVVHLPIKGKLFLEWGQGVSWYNFKFQSDQIVMSRDESGVIFTEDNRDVNYIKSKLTASYIGTSLIPILDFGGRGDKSRMWDSRGSRFRIGLGPYAGYRLGSHSKLVFNDGRRQKEKEFDNFFLNNFRYGMRLQVGVRNADFFFNYDLNELFSTTPPNNPKLNAFSFGIVF
ncbi:MAG: PorT family protein [Cyclobacteriaceae bacterium]|jgi:hypothetical protein|nr:PorT family protein [Cyclobacteriaceae bacterium]